MMAKGPTAFTANGAREMRRTAIDSGLLLLSANARSAENTINRKSGLPMTAFWSADNPGCSPAPGIDCNITATMPSVPTEMQLEAYLIIIMSSWGY